MGIGEGKCGFNLGFIRSGPDEIRGRPLTEQQGDRVNEKGLPRPRFTGQHDEPGGDGELELLDQRKVGDTQLAEHEPR